jgi:hypothetical protein
VQTIAEAAPDTPMPRPRPMYAPSEPDVPMPRARPTQFASAAQSDASPPPPPSPFLPPQATPDISLPGNGPQDVTVTQAGQAPQQGVPGQPPVSNQDYSQQLRAVVGGHHAPPQHVATWIDNALQQPNIDPAITPAYMRAVAAVESDYDPSNRTGSYHGLYQLGNNPNARGAADHGWDEWQRYGNNGDILNGQDNANAYARMASEHARQLRAAGIDPTPQNLYLTHQQGFGAVRSGNASRANMVGNRPPTEPGATRDFGSFSRAWGRYLNTLMDMYGEIPTDQLPSIGGHAEGRSVKRAVQLARAAKNQPTRYR